MPIYNFTKIKSHKTLQKLALDLLEAEGFHLSSEPSPTGEGINILAEESIISHAGFSHTLHWFVNCIHSGGTQLQVQKVQQSLDAFDNRSEDGLLIVVDADIPEDGLLILEEYVNRPTNNLQISKNAAKSEASRKHLITLRQILETRFSDSELRTLCFDLGVDYEGLPGEGKLNKVRELISYLDRRDRIHQLTKIGKKLRPEISWEGETDSGPNVSKSSSQKKPLIQIWDQRQLENRLLRHPLIAQKYKLVQDTAIASPFFRPGLEDKSILIISDTSTFAYQLFSTLNKVSANVQIITFWQYSDPARLQLLFKDILDTPHDLVIFFLGDTFGFPIPDMILEKVLKTAAAGKGIIFFPFFAWALHQGAYQALDKLIPVKLVDEPRKDQLWLKASRFLAGDDYTWLNAEAFIENQPATIKVDNRHPLLKEIEHDFDLIHSFEFLTIKEQANCILTDNIGTPFLVINEATTAPIVYINSCTHNCLSKTHILSPFEISDPFQKLIVNTISWCLKLES
ncbi:MAG: hypothetical protein CL608_08680 [Anaerolineaceae bacterium]|nr:hypothetical protein [Anaerolineaceae bacterium]